MITLEKSPIDIDPNPIYELAMGFAAAKVLMSAHRLGLFEALGTAAKTSADIAKSLHYSERATEMLLNGCVSLKLCTKKEGLFQNTPLSLQYLVPGKRGFLGNFINHFNDHMYPAWFHLEEAVRTGHAQIQRVIGQNTDHFFQAVDRKSQDLETFMLTMEEHSFLEGSALAKVYDFSTHQKLLDLAGGTGAMTVSILERYPHLDATLFDRPPVCEIAGRCLARHGMGERVNLVPGDIFTSSMPTGADVVLLSAILHNWSPVNAKAILAQCHRALVPNGTLLISDQILSEDKTAPYGAVMCSINMLVVMDGGQEYSLGELQGFLQETGFRLEEVRPTGTVRQLLIARRI